MNEKPRPESEGPGGHDGEAALDVLRARIADDRHARLFDLWRAKRAGALLPRRADFDVAELKFVLPYVNLVDVMPDGRMRHRLVGTEVVAMVGRDPTGTYHDEFPSDHVRELGLKVLREVAAARFPYFGYRDIEIDGRPRRYHTLNLPLAANGVEVDMVLVCVLPQPAPATR